MIDNEMGDEACCATTRYEIFEITEPRIDIINAEEDLDDDKLDYLHLKGGDFLGERFQIIKMIGSGHFSTVWLGWDVSGGNFVALKISRYSNIFYNAVSQEYTILHRIHNTDSMDTRHTKIIQLPKAFKVVDERANQVCLVYKEVGEDLYDFMLKYHITGFPIQIVKSIIRQVLEGLDYLHTKCKIIHTDIKPENVLICLNESEIRKIADEASLSVPNIVKFWDLPKKSSSEKLTNEMQGGKNIEKSVQIEDGKANFKMQFSEEQISKNNTLKTNSGGASGVINVEEEKPSKPAENEGKKDVESVQKFVSYSPNEEILRSSGYSMESSKAGTFDSIVNIKILDFNSACLKTLQVEGKIQTRNYRAPEVLIGARYDTSVDIWSVACMAFELATGYLLFDPTTVEGISIDEIHIGHIMQLLGPIPTRIIKSGTKSPLFFEPSGDLKHCNIIETMDLSQNLITVHGWSPVNAKLFSEFLKIMLHYDPKMRASASECLRHPWLSN